MIKITATFCALGRGQLLERRIVNHAFHGGNREEQFIFLEHELTWKLSAKVEFYFIFRWL